MKKLIPVFLMLLLFFSGCSKEETAVYDLVVCDSNLTSLNGYMDSFENENYKVETVDFKADQAADLLACLEKDSDGLNSITVYSQTLTDQQAEDFVLLAQSNNIPIIFSFADISDEILDSYDKAVSIDTDYYHAAEITARKMTDYWHDSIILDTDENLIFRFAVVTDENSPADYKHFHDSLIDCIELYGIPMQLSGTVLSEDITSDEDIEELKEENEGVIIISDSAAAYIENYNADGDGVEIITISHSDKNIWSEKFSVLNCFVDHRQYKKAADEIISNFNSHRYLFDDISFPYINKTIYISATV